MKRDAENDGCAAFIAAALSLLLALFAAFIVKPELIGWAWAACILTSSAACVGFAFHLISLIRTKIREN